MLGYTFVGGNDALDFFDIVAIGKQVGFDITELSLNWSDFEGEGQGTEHGPWNDAHLIAVNTYYKNQGLKIIVVFSPINRERNYLPDDLQGLPWDHPDVVARFKTWIDHVLDIVQNPGILAVGIGNEVEGLLKNFDDPVNPDDCIQFRNLFLEAKTHIKTRASAVTDDNLPTDVMMGIKAGSDGLLGSHVAEMQFLNAVCDIVFVNHFGFVQDQDGDGPGDVMVDTPWTFYEAMDQLANPDTGLYPTQKLAVMEVGYNSDEEALNSSEEAQAQFVETMFQAWDLYESRMPYLIFYSLHDLSTARVNLYLEYYGVSCPPLAPYVCDDWAAYLGTLGLLTNGEAPGEPVEGRPKLSYLQMLQSTMTDRDWSTYGPGYSGGVRFLTVAKEPFTEIRLDWNASCLPDTDYEVYEGALGGDFTSHTSLFCSTGGESEKSFEPAAGSSYYLVVPGSGIREGSYGTDSSGVERPQGSFACRLQVIAECP